MKIKLHDPAPGPAIGKQGHPDNGGILLKDPGMTSIKKNEKASTGIIRRKNPDRTRAGLLKCEELVNAIFQTTDMGIALFDEQGRYLKTNKGYNELLGYEDGELEGRSFTFTAPAGYKKESKKKLARLFLDGDTTGERLAVRKNGELLSVLRTAKIIRNPDGTKFLLVTIRDITESIKYRHLLNNSNKVARIGEWEFDIASGNIKCTGEMYQILEVSESTLKKISTDWKLLETFEPDDGKALRKVWTEAIHPGKSFDIELEITTGDRERKWVRITCTPESLQSKPVKLYGTLRDITIQKHNERQLERLSLVASKTNNAVFITDDCGNTIWINESVEKMTGFNRRELLGKKPGVVLQGIDSDPACIERMSKRLKKHLPVSEVIKNYKKDGSSFWINMDIAPVFRKDKLENFIGIGVDVTELVRARESEKIKNALEHRQKMFNAIAKNFPDGIIGVLDQKLHYIFAGGSEISRLGLTVDDFIGNNIFDHITEKNNDTAASFLSKAQAGFPVSFEAEIKENTYAVSAVPLQSDDEFNTQILVVLYNITKRKKAEAEVKEALEQQKELNDLKSKFVSIASHEFRTPLSTILSSTFLISKYGELNETGKAQKHVERIEAAVRILTDILNDFLSLGRIEDGKTENHPVRFNVTEFCETLADEVQPTLKKGQSIIYRHEAGNNSLFQDKRHLRNVLINLLSNAAKYSDEGKPIWLTTACKNGQMQFTIKDVGIGIPLSDQPRLFQTFFRANNAIHIQGTGMGLHIVKRFLDSMGGTIHFTSVEHKGSSFTVQFSATGS